jgi:tetratricopeptide (TPR) repeat protein
MARGPSEYDDAVASVLGAGCLLAVLKSPVFWVLFVIVLIIGWMTSCNEKEAAKTTRYESCKGLYQQGQYQSSLECFGNAIAEGADEYDAFVWRGYASLRLGDLSMAEEDFDKAHSKESKLPMTNIALADLAKARGDQELALGYFETGFNHLWGGKTIELKTNKKIGGKGNIGDYLALMQGHASITEEKGDLKKALELYQKAIYPIYCRSTSQGACAWKITSDNLLLPEPPYTTFMTLEETLTKEMALQKALKTSDTEFQFTESDELNASYFLEVVRCQRKVLTEDASVAASCYRDLAKRSLDPLDEIRFIGDTFRALTHMYDAKEWQDYVSVVDSALEIADKENPEHRYSELLRNRAIGNRETGSYEEALNDVNRSLQMDDSGDRFRGYVTRAAILRRTQEHAKALDDYSEALWLIHQRSDWLEEHAEEDETVSIPAETNYINNMLKDIYEGQRESFRVFGRIKESKNASKAVVYCVRKIERQDPNDTKFRKGTDICLLYSDYSELEKRKEKEESKDK